MQSERARWHRVRLPRQRWWHALRDWSLELVVHAEALPGLRVPHFRYIWSLDDFDCRLVYQGNEIRLIMDWEGDFCLDAATEVPEDVFDFVCRHFDSFKGVSRFEVLRLGNRYLRPANATWIEK
jgi:hypothetical protein